ncbi:RadC family protein [Desulfopila aestuarii]|uniref:DNA repair protein RadC n=1 Tax=Desulfopila aestuarii DSM 18488 TaxID=1121416 RepID=A0A1M7XWA8_9BACT|nr:DNA repair protein RadC [Desulfopila aestuarii]SHO43017.1 DNA repair protein RadC [Desulfopila aestuarii DSM 18488]
MDKEHWQQKGEGHRGRLRDRYLERGIDGFSDAEVLELLLSFGTPRSDTKEPARDLLNRYGTLAAVLEASPAGLQEVKGVGPKNSFAISFVQAVAGRYLQQRLTGRRYLHSSKDVREYLEHSMRGLKREVLTVIYLDSAHAILGSEVVAEGTINVNTVYPRELVQRAINNHAAAIIMAHNHPSGSLQPSPQDISLTKNIYFICSFLQIQLLDHFIIGDGVYSFADDGLIDAVASECLSLRETLNRR